MNLLYVYADRHPESLRQLVLGMIPQNIFTVKKMSYSDSIADQIEAMRWAEVVLFAPGRHLDDEVIKAASNVKLMQLWSSGYDKFNLTAATSSGIPVANNGGANRIAVAEHTILLILSVYKRLLEANKRAREGNWSGNSHGMDMYTIYGKTVGLIGLGAIGREVAARLRSFGARILYYDINRLDKQNEHDLGVEYAELEDLYRNADIISPHLHVSPATINMIGDRELTMMKSSVILINVSRGELIDETALLNALDDGRIAGVGLDVFRQEPTTPGDPLVNHKNVVATPHMACTYDTHVMALEASIENLKRVYDGLEPCWIVN